MADDIEQLAKLISGSIKLRGTILLICIVALMIVWSSLENGNKTAPAVDLQFCMEMIARPDITQTVPDFKAFFSPQKNWARVGIDRVRQGLTEPLASAIYRPNQEQTVKQRFEEYDKKRKETYQLKLQLPYAEAGGPVVINALSLAEIAPFVVLALLAAVCVLGFQEDFYKVQLTHRVRGAGQDERAMALAKSQFLMGISDRMDARNKRSFRNDWFVGPPPGGLILSSLYAGFLYWRALLLRESADNVVRLKESVFFSYSFVLYAGAFVVGWLVLNTRKALLSQRASLGLEEGNALRTKTATGKWWVPSAAAFAGLASFLLPWLMHLQGQYRPLHIQGKVFWAGYHFLFRGPASALDGIQIAPRILYEIRIQVWFSILFFILCAVRGLLPRLGGRSSTLLPKACLWMSIGALFLSLNYWFYMCVLWYQLTLGIPWPFLLLDPRGSMINFAPGPGFLLFTCCCASLIGASLRADRVNESVPRADATVE